jgi:hypothetical protein
MGNITRFCLLKEKRKRREGGGGGEGEEEEILEEGTSSALKYQLALTHIYHTVHAVMF